MWVGPGGFIGNFAFRFTKEVLFFQTLFLSHISNVISVHFLLETGFDSRLFSLSQFSANRVQKLRFYNLKKTGNIAGSHCSLLLWLRNERERVERSGLLPHLIYYC